MKMRAIILTMLAALILIVGCGRADYNRIEDRGESAPSYYAARGLGFDDSMVRYETPASTSWAGSGYVLEGPAGVESFTGSTYGQSSDRTGTQPTSFDESISAAIPEDTRKLVKRANINIRVENLEAAGVYVAEMLEKFNSYSASTLINENSHYYSLRVPAPLYDVFLAEMSGIGRLIHRTETTDDVTLQFYDLEGRLESRRELLRTFQTYLRRANNMNEILTVETRIADIQREIDNTGTKLRNLTNRIDYATIELYIQGPVAAVKYKSETFGEKIKQLFKGFGGFLSSTAIILLGVVVYGIPSLAIAILLFWLLFGKIGLLKKLWRLIMAKKQG